MSADYRIHPAAKIFPLMDDATFAEFCEDIRQHGQRDPIDLLNGQLLDGRNRLRACQVLGLIPLVRELPDHIDPIAYVASANLYRRHLNESQRGLAAGRMKTLYEEAARERQREGGKKAGRGRPKEEQVSANLREPISDPEDNKSSAKAAAAMNVSPRTVDAASRVLGKGVPELIDLVEKGKVSVSAAATVAQLPRPEQERVLAEGPEAVRGKAKEIREKLPPMPEEDAEDERIAELARRWHKIMHDLYMLMNSVRDAGGIEAIVQGWEGKARRKLAEELGRISALLGRWDEHLQGMEE